MNPEANEPSNGVGHLHVPPPSVARLSARGRRLLDMFLSGLGVGPRREAQAGPEPKKTSTALAAERTDFAMNRTDMAAERTLMAWIRTDLSMISFGFTIGKIGQALSEVEVRGLKGMRVVGVGTIASFLVVLGTLSLLAASVQYCVRIHRLHELGMPRQISIAFPVALILVVLGGVALSSLVLHL